MSAQRITFSVLGLPAPQGSKRHVGHGVMVESSAAVKPWREDVKQAALAALHENPEWDRRAAEIYLHVVFTLPRPRSHYRTGKFANLMRDRAPSRVSTKPDLDKLLRSTGDALTSAGVYVDDSRIVQVFATKVYESRGALPVGAMEIPGARIVLSTSGES